MNTSVNSSLFLIPNLLSNDATDTQIPDSLRQSVHHLTQFVVEDEKAARALIKKLKIATSQQDIQIMRWNEHSQDADLKSITEFISKADTGIISEAGLPCIADPGADLVAWAHRKQIKVVPLAGASSFMLALMASGFNGQSFVFHGYLPIDKPKRAQAIKEMCLEAEKKNRSQIVMDAPYRNNQLLDEFIRHAPPSSKLCIACNLTSQEEWVITKNLSAWSSHKPDLHKKPVVFIVGK